MSRFELSRNEVSSNILGIFSSDRSYNYPGTFANRQRSRRVLEDIVESKSYKVAVVSGIFGSGKTMLVDMVKNTFKMPEGELLSVRRVRKEKLENQYETYGLLIIDDVDIRTSWQRVQTALEELRSFLETRPCPVIIMGDFITRNPVLRKILDFTEVTDVPFEPLTRSFFLESLNLRLRFAYDKSEDDIPADSNVFYEEDVISCLTPESDESSSNFREVLTLSREMALLLEPNDVVFRLGGEEARSYFLRNPLRLELEVQRTFVKSWLLPYIRERFPYGKNVKAFTAEDIIEDGGVTETVGDASNLETEVLAPLAAGGVLQARGVPFLDSMRFVRYPGPYVPSSSFLLRAYFDPGEI